MKTLAAIVLALFSVSAFAGGGNYLSPSAKQQQQQQQQQQAKAKANAKANAAALAGALSVSDAQVGDITTQGGHGGAGGAGGAGGMGGTGMGGAGGSANNSNNADVDVDVNTTNPKEAPSVWVTAPNSTAKFMKCIGLGGSTNEGAATGAWCWLQKDLYAEHRSEQLAYYGMYPEAAQAYCGRKLHWKDFGSKEVCIERYATMVAARVESDPDYRIEGVILEPAGK